MVNVRAVKNAVQLQKNVVQFIKTGISSSVANLKVVIKGL